MSYRSLGGCSFFFVGRIKNFLRMRARREKSIGPTFTTSKTVRTQVDSGMDRTLLLSRSSLNCLGFSE